MGVRGLGINRVNNKIRGSLPMIATQGRQCLELQIEAKSTRPL